MDHPFRTAPARTYPPPRAVPWRLKVRILFGGLFPQLGWGFAALGALVFAALLQFTEPPFRSFDRVAEGRVVSVTATDGETMNERTYEVEAVFEDERGTEHRVHGYTEQDWSRGQVVRVGYDLDEPAEGRVQGTRTRRLPSILWIGIAFPLLGAGFGLFRIRNARRILRLLSVGVATRGELVAIGGSEPKSGEIVERDVTFSYVVDDRTYQCEAVTHNVEALQDEPTEALIYDPRRPWDATPLDHLPGAPKLRDDDTLESDVAAIEFLVLPAMTAIALVVGAVLHFVR